MSASGKRFAALAAASLAIATMLGAYTSHGLQGVETRAAAAVDTAVRFQFYHGLALLIVALLVERLRSVSIDVAAWLLVAGTLLFCGGIYATYLLGLEAFSAVTPFGGLCFIAAWVMVGVAVLRAP